MPFYGRYRIRLRPSVAFGRLRAYIYLTRTRRRFPNLKSRNKVGPKSSPEEIEDELHYIQLQLGSSTQSGNFGAVALCTAMACLERSTSSRVLDNPLNLDLRGLGAL